MSAPLVVQCSVFEDSTFYAMARLLGASGATVTQASFASISWSAYNERTAAEIVAPTALVVSTVVFDTLQTDARWSADAVGYNFRHAVPYTTFSDGGITARIEYRATMTGGEVFDLAHFRCHVIDSLSH